MQEYAICRASLARQSPYTWRAGEIGELAGNGVNVATLGELANDWVSSWVALFGQSESINESWRLQRRGMVVRLETAVVVSAVVTADMSRHYR